MSQQYQTIVLASGESRELAMRGKVFACDSATGDFGVRFGNSAEITGSSKRVFGSSTSPEFNRVTLRNAAGVTNTIIFAVAFQDIRIETNITNVVASITVAAMQNAETYTKGSTATLGGGGVTFSGLNGSDVRKSFSIFNNEVAGSGNNILVLGDNGTAGHVVTPQSSYVVESGDAISLSGSGFTYYVMEVFYA